MGETSQPAEENFPAPRRRRRRWLIRLGASLLLLALVLVIAIGVVWHRRTEMLNRLLATALTPWRVEAGALDVHFKSGTVELRDIRFRDAPDTSEWARADRLRLTASWAGLRERRIESAEFEGLDLHFTNNVLAQLKKWAAPRTAGASGPGGAHVAHFVLRDATITVDLPDFPRVEMAFDYSGQGLDFGTRVNLGRQRLNVRQFQATAPDAGALQLGDGIIAFSLAGDDNRLVLHQLALPQLKAHITPGLMAFLTSPAAARGARPSHPAAALPSLLIESLDVGALDFRYSGYVDHPEVSFKGRANGRAAEWNGFLTAGLQDWALHDLLVVDPAQPATPLLSVSSIEARFTASRQGGAMIEQAKLERASVVVRPVVLDWLARANPPTPSAGTAASAGAIPLIHVRELVLADAAIALSGLTNSPHLPVALPDAECKTDATFNDLRISADGKIESAAVQQIALRMARAAFDPESPFLKFPSAEIEIVPDDFFGRREVRRLRWFAPEVHLSSALFAAFQKQIPPEVPATKRSTSADNPPDTAEPAPEARRSEAPPGEKGFWHGLHARNLEVAGGRLTLSGFGPDFPNIETEVAIGTAGSPGRYQVRLANLQAAAPALPDLPFARLVSVVGEVDPHKVWDRRLDSVTINGGNVEIGEAVRSFESAAPAAAAGPDPQPEAVSAGPPWTIGQAAILDTGITVSNIVPLLDPVGLQLSFSATELPLSREGLEGQNEPQRIELTGIRLNSSSPTGPLPVASFETVFVGFSMAGLLEQRIDRIELVSPVVYVGEQLFWYVDYFRQTTGGEKRPAQTTATGGDTQAGWSVSHIDAHFGRMVLALKGDVLDALPPLPFSCSTQLEEGRAELVLEIPRGTYRPSTRIPLELDVEEGSAAFNLPLKQESNNLVQMFRVSELRYGRGQPFRAQNAYTSVTYDKNGVYAKFGGKLYGGYVSGAFNLYLDDNLSWDGWLFGENIQTRPLTDIMTPEYFRMSGACSFKVLAYGDMESLYTASGNISTSSSGQMTITGLDPLKKQLPDDWSRLQRSLTENGIETVRDFPYETCRGDFEIFGREANLKLDVKGPAGGRFFDLRVHNHTVPATLAHE